MTGKTHSSNNMSYTDDRTQANESRPKRADRSRSPSRDRNDEGGRIRSPQRDHSIYESESTLTEDEIIEMRRKKREALMAKLGAEQEVESPISPSVSESDNLFDLSHLSHSQSAVEGESATDYDETINDDRNKIKEPEPAPSEESEDSDEDDMFADSPPAKTVSSSNNRGKKLDSSLLDNWDDVEGYYRVIPGEILDGKYLVGTTLGKGMFAAVVRATDQETNNLVAIKVIRNNESMHKEGLKELGILKSVNEHDPHNKRHVVRLLRSFEHKDHLCLVFENLDCNLRDILKKFGRNVGINIQAIKSYTRQLLLGLALLRECNVMHADLKPDNVLVNDKHNMLKICDLGSASYVSENDITPYLVSRFYRAPELILGLPYNYAIDMWSVGCTLYELYTGKILFPGNSNNHMLKIIMETQGKFSHKMLRKGQFTFQHFDENLDFLSAQVDQITGQPVTKVIKTVGPLPAQTLKSRLAGLEDANPSSPKAKMLEQFTDLLEKMIITNPEKRITPLDGLKHPFVAT